MTRVAEKPQVPALPMETLGGRIAARRTRLAGAGRLLTALLRIVRRRRPPSVQDFDERMLRDIGLGRGSGWRANVLLAKEMRRLQELRRWSL